MLFVLTAPPEKEKCKKEQGKYKGCSTDGASNYCTSVSRHSVVS